MSFGYNIHNIGKTVTKKHTTVDDVAQVWYCLEQWLINKIQLCLSTYACILWFTAAFSLPLFETQNEIDSASYYCLHHHSACWAKSRFHETFASYRQVKVMGGRPHKEKMNERSDKKQSKTQQEDRAKSTHKKINNKKKPFFLLFEFSHKSHSFCFNSTSYSATESSVLCSTLLYPQCSCPTWFGKCRRGQKTWGIAKCWTHAER